MVKKATRMGNSVDRNTILSFIKKVNERYRKPGKIYLLGRSALTMLGNSRRTLDIDFYFEDGNNLSKVIQEIADEVHLYVDIVPITEFIPVFFCLLLILVHQPDIAIFQAG